LCGGGGVLHGPDPKMFYEHENATRKITSVRRRCREGLYGTPQDLHVDAYLMSDSTGQTRFVSSIAMPFSLTNKRGRSSGDGGELYTVGNKWEASY
jgi:hypothetical protein